MRKESKVAESPERSSRPVMFTLFVFVVLFGGYYAVVNHLPMRVMAEFGHSAIGAANGAPVYTDAERKSLDELVRKTSGN